MKTLSPKDLARSIGVSESSVKRWVDDGTLTATRTAGGHRRIPVPEAVRLVRRLGAPLEHPDLLVGARSGARVAPFSEREAAVAANRLFELLQQDDAPAARGMLLSLYLSGWTVAAICDGPMRMALERIGTLWEHGPSGIVIEHRATTMCLHTLAELRTLFPPVAADAPVAVGGALSGDPYLVPSLMASTVLAELGYRDHNLGPETPLAALEHAIERYRPRLAWLAMSVPPPADLARAVTHLASTLASRGGALVVGGRGVPALGEPPGLVRVGSMAELAAFARGALVTR